MTVALLVEIYREFGLKFDDIIRELEKTITGIARVSPDEEKSKSEPDNESSMAMLNAMMTGTDFRGVR